MYSYVSRTETYIAPSFSALPHTEITPCMRAFLLLHIRMSKIGVPFRTSRNENRPQGRFSCVCITRGPYGLSAPKKLVFFWFVDTYLRVYGKVLLKSTSSLVCSCILAKYCFFEPWIDWVINLYIICHCISHVCLATITSPDCWLRRKMLPRNSNVCVSILPFIYRHI